MRDERRRRGGWGHRNGEKGREDLVAQGLGSPNAGVQFRHSRGRCCLEGARQGEAKTGRKVRSLEYKTKMLHTLR